MSSRSLLGIKVENVTGNMAELGLSAESLLLLLQPCNLFLCTCTRFLLLAVTYMEVMYVEAGYSAMSAEVIGI
jgi:hypothetical protein